MERSEGLGRFDCNVSGRSCQELVNWRGLYKESRVLSRDDRTESGLTSYATRVIRCASHIDAEIAERCDVTPPNCECTGLDCTLPISEFNPFSTVLGDSTDGYDMEPISLLCPPPEFGYGHYSECDDGTVRYEMVVGGENRYVLGFDRGSTRPSYGRADGYVLTEFCGLVDSDIAVISAGEPPAASTCRTCKFCESDWDSSGEGGAGGGGGMPDCEYDRLGRISVPGP